MIHEHLTAFHGPETNAFGDLLSGLTGLPESGAAGLDCHAAQVARLLTLRSAA
ncbi:hypothetical protein [Streptosporangium sp. H16]|uniref:hypothetical protein n=1 Tax=Streptosporangium sp. H16 TaxID=3444184 RepID=UPI003F7AFCFF